MTLDALSEILRDRVAASGLSQAALGDALHDWPAAKIRVLLVGTLRAGEVSLPQAVSLGHALGMSLDTLAEAAGLAPPGGEGKPEGALDLRPKTVEQMAEQILDAIGGQNTPDACAAVMSAVAIHFPNIWLLSGWSLTDALDHFDRACAQVAKQIRRDWGEPGTIALGGEGNG